MAWRDNLTCDTVAEAVEELADTFTAVDLARKSTQVQKLNGSGSATLLAQVHSTPDYYSESTMTDGVVKHQSPDGSPIASPNTIEPPLAQRIKRKCTAATCGWTICYSTLGLLVVSALVAVATVKNTPKTRNSISPPSVGANDTVELSFSLSTVWLKTLSLSIDQDCTGVAYTYRGKCSDLYPTARVCYKQSQYSEAAHRVNYLLPGSYFNFTVGAGYDCQTDIWITWNPELLYKTNYSGYSCENPPPQTKCLHPPAERSERVVPVTEAGYYSTYVSPPPQSPCFLNYERYICSYNVTRLKEVASAVTQEPIRSDLVSVDLLYRPYSFTQVCTVLHVEKDGTHCRSYNGGALSVETERRQDVLLFPGLLLCLAVVVLVAVALSHITTCVVRRRRQRVRPLYQRLHDTHV
jgi:hypothetical protein